MGPFFLSSVELAYTSATTQDIYREGVWASLALIYDVLSIPAWQAFLRWLTGVTAYDDEMALSSATTITPITSYMSTVGFRFDPVCLISEYTGQEKKPGFTNAVSLCQFLQTPFREWNKMTNGLAKQSGRTDDHLGL